MHTSRAENVLHTATRGQENGARAAKSPKAECQLGQRLGKHCGGAKGQKGATSQRDSGLRVGVCTGHKDAVDEGKQMP